LLFFALIAASVSFPFFAVWLNSASITPDGRYREELLRILLTWACVSGSLAWIALQLLALGTFKQRQLQLGATLWTNLIVALAIAGVWAYPALHLLFPGEGGGGRNPDGFGTVRRFSAIARALQRSAWESGGRLPSKLSDLVPRYIPADGLSLFHPPCAGGDGENGLPPDRDVKPGLADGYSDCVYLGAPGIPRGLIAHERSGPRRCVITPDFGTHHMSESNLNIVLRSDGGEVLEGLRADRASIYGYNLSASLNAYHMKLGAYPRGDNASVIRALLGENPKGIRLHFRHESEKSAQGEDLDPWGTPYQIESDGNVVRIKSAGKNRTFDRVGAEGYDDICCSIAGGSPFSSDEKF